jgi:hypothetical protein
VASANLALAHLPTPDQRIDGHLEKLLLSVDRSVAVTAAVALAYRLGAAVPDTVLAILLADQAAAIGVIGWDRGLNGFVSLALQRLELKF